MKVKSERILTEVLFSFRALQTIFDCHIFCCAVIDAPRVRPGCGSTKCTVGALRRRLALPGDVH